MQTFFLICDLKNEPEAIQAYVDCHKAVLDNANPKVQEWEAFLGQYQTNLPGTPPNWRWAICEKIFEFKAS